jgi:hypothetical protein
MATSSPLQGPLRWLALAARSQPACVQLISAATEEFFPHAQHVAVHGLCRDEGVAIAAPFESQPRNSQPRAPVQRPCDRRAVGRTRRSPSIEAFLTSHPARRLKPSNQLNGAAPASPIGPSPADCSSSNPNHPIATIHTTIDGAQVRSDGGLAAVGAEHPAAARPARHGPPGSEVRTRPRGLG